MHFFQTTVDDPEFGFLQKFIVAELPAGESVEYLLEVLYTNLSPYMRANFSLIIRTSVKQPVDPQKIDLAIQNSENPFSKEEHVSGLFEELTSYPETIFLRFPTNSVYILSSWDYQPYISANINPKAHSPLELSPQRLQDLLLHQIQNAEIDELVARGNCKLPPLGNRVYKVPSGRFVRSFLRVGNMQTSRSAIDAVFFWLLPHLKGCAGVVTDTWSISSISQNISRRLVDYNEATNNPPPIEMLGDYHFHKGSYGRTAAEVIERFFSRIQNQNGQANGTVLVLLSATHTNSLATLLREFFEDRQLPTDRIEFVSLFKLSADGDIPSLRDLSEDRDFQPIETDENTTDHTAISIDSKLYFPVSSIDVVKRHLIDVIAPYQDFGHRYKDVDFARVHKTDTETIPGEVRHHAVWIDTEQLFQSDPFRERFFEKLDALPAFPKLIVHPDHTSAVALAELAKQFFASKGADVDLVCHDNLNLDLDLSPTDIEINKSFQSLSSEHHVLILDDAFIEGNRIAAYLKNERDIPFEGTYHFICGIARPPSDGDWKEQKRSFKSMRADNSGAVTLSGHFEYVEMLILPNWDQDDCPWCKERKIVDNWTWPVEPIPREDDGGAGLIDDIFLRDPDSEKYDLKRGSFIGPEGLNQASIYCLVAGTIQSLRSTKMANQPVLGDSHFMVSTVLNPAYYLTFFTDSVLVASIIRSLRPNEMAFTNMEREKARTKKIKKFVAKDTNRDLACEVYLAASTEKIPHLS